MATINLAVRLDGYPDFSFEQELDERVYQFTFTWNEREEYWYFDLADDSGSPIAEGIKVVVNWDLIRRSSDARRPPGNIIALDTTNQNLDPTQAELGNRVLMVYQPEGTVT